MTIKITKNMKELPHKYSAYFTLVSGHGKNRKEEIVHCYDLRERRKKLLESGEKIITDYDSHIPNKSTIEKSKSSNSKTKRYKRSQLIIEDKTTELPHKYSAYFTVVSGHGKNYKEEIVHSYDLRNKRKRSKE